MVIFDNYTFNKYEKLKLTLKKRNIIITDLDHIENLSSSENKIICIFHINKCFIDDTALNFLKSQEKFNNLDIILVLDSFDNSEAVINYVRNYSRIYSKNYNIIAEFDVNDENSLISLLIKPQPELDRKVTIYTDGACSGNPGAGGWAAILMDGKNKKIISGGASETTNNRMELIAVIEALKALKKSCDIEIYSDSAYVVNAYLLNWMDKWKLNRWKNSDKKPVKNIELWKELDKEVQKHKVQFFRVQGHADNEYNNECDKLAVEQSKRFKKD